jgi:hypothetical protein
MIEPLTKLLIHFTQLSLNFSLASRGTTEQVLHQHDLVVQHNAQSTAFCFSEVLHKTSHTYIYPAAQIFNPSR